MKHALSFLFPLLCCSAFGDGLDGKVNQPGTVFLPQKRSDVVKLSSEDCAPLHLGNSNSKYDSLKRAGELKDKVNSASTVSRFRDCLNKVRAKNQEQGKSQIHVNHLKLKVTVGLDGAVTAQTDENYITSLPLNEDPKEAAAQIEIARCYAMEISKIRLPESKASVKPLCWDGLFPIESGQRNWTKMNGDPPADNAQ